MKVSCRLSVAPHILMYLYPARTVILSAVLEARLRDKYLRVKGLAEDTY